MGHPQGKPPDALTVEHGAREKVDMRWPVGLIARVDQAALVASVLEGRRVSRTEWTLRQVLAGLVSAVPVDAPPAVRVKNPAMVAVHEAKAVVVADLAADVKATQDECSHPVDARRRLGYMTRCGVCGRRMDQ